jgi:hypothetical protein
MDSVVEKFKQMGVDCQVLPCDRWHSRLSVDVQTERKTGKPFFQIYTPVDLQVLDVDPKDRHLVLMAREKHAKPKFLCGFDERGWFTAALPEPQHVRWFPGTKPSMRIGISNVETAKAALKPAEVVEEEYKRNVKRNKRSKRHNKASKRQGEWFFVPRSITVDPKDILKNEPIQMGGKRQHMCAEVYRSGGTVVMVSSQYPNGVTLAEYDKLSKEHRKGWDKIVWTRRVAEAKVYARGAVSAPDHATLHLAGWHEVIPNTESRASHAVNVRFLD